MLIFIRFAAMNHQTKGIGVFILSLFFLLSTLPSLFSQNIADSLLVQARYAKTDSARIKTLSALQVHWSEINSDSSIYYGKKLKDLALKHNDAPHLFMANMYMAYSLNNLGAYEVAISLVYDAMKHPSVEEHLKYKANYLSFLGEMCRASEQFPAAIQHLNEANKITLPLQDSMFHAQVHNRLAAIYFELENFKLAKQHIDSSLNVLQSGGLSSLRVNNLELMGAIYRETGEYQKAAKYLSEALEVSREINNLSGIPNILNNLAMTYFNLGDYNAAIKAASESYDISDEKDLQALKIIAALWLSNSYSKLQDFENAFRYAKIHQELFKEIYQNEKNELIADYNAKYESEKKQRRIDVQKFMIEEEHVQNRVLLFGIVFSVLLLGILIFFLFRIRKFNRLLGKQKGEIEEQSQNLNLAHQKLQELADFKDNMTGMIAHDLKAPLNMILSSNPEKEKEQYVPVVRQHARSILALVMNMLDISRYENTEMKLCLHTVPVQSIVQKVVTDFSLLINKKNLSLKIEITDGLMVHADKNILKRIFTNLLSNAIKFSPANANIYIKAHKSDEDEVTFELCDQGAGIDPEKWHLIFEKFKQVERRSLGLTGSTGLGLTFCKMAVEAHGGKIGVSKHSDQGSRFWFTMKYAGIEKKITPIIKANTTNDPLVALKLTYEEKTQLKPYIEKFSTCRIYEISKIYNFIEQLNREHPLIFDPWIHSLINAANTNNLELFQELTFLSNYEEK